MRMKWMAAAIAGLCIAGAATAAKAGTVTLQFLGGTGSEPTTNGQSVSVYPYQFSVNGSNTDTSLLCISFDNEITTNETWTATVTQLSSSSSSFDKEEAYLFSLISGTGNATKQEDIQFADWYLSDSNAVKQTTFYKDNTSAILGYVYQAETTGLDESNSFYNQFDLYTPVDGSQPCGDGLPQTFIGDPPLSSTPEPGSLALLGTGLVGLGGALRRRLRKA